MIKPNLLPPEEKNQIKLYRAQRWIVFYGFSLLSACIIFAVFLGVIWLYLSLQVKAFDEALVTANASLQGQKLKEQQTLVRELNALMKKTNQFFSPQKNYSEIIGSLAQMVPEGIRIEGLSLDKEGTIKLSAHAQTRAQVLAFKDAIEKSPLFDKVDSPLSNLVKQQDINFQFTFKLKQ